MPQGPIRRRVAADVAGLHLALNVFVATALLWIVIRKWAGLNPIWAISAMLASSDPHVRVAAKHVRSRLINAVLGCVVGLVFLLLAGAFGASGDWKLPLALATTALEVSSSAQVRELLDRAKMGQVPPPFISREDRQRMRAGLASPH